MTPDDYLELERTSDVKHELINGEVYAMAGGSAEHGALVLAVARALGNALEGKPCRTFSSDVRVRVEFTASNFYLDVSVVCGKLATARDDEHAITNPVVLVEVLSDSTERNDRGPKAAHYRRLPSLKEYVLVSQDERRVEVQRLNGTARGSFTSMVPVTLSS